MVGIIIATHYTLAESLKETSSMIIGEKENVVALSLLKEDNMDTFTGKLKEAVDKIDTGDGVLILVDMFGGTPSNTALATYKDADNVQIISGVSLPLVIEAAMHSSKGLDETVKSIMERKDKVIINVKELLNKRM